MSKLEFRGSNKLQQMYRAEEVICQKTQNLANLRTHRAQMFEAEVST